MKRKSIIALLLLMSVASIGGSSMAQRSLMRKDKVVQLVEAYDAAWMKKDVATIERVLAADYVYFSSEGGVWNRQRTMTLLRSPRYILTSAERNELEVHRTGNTAVVSSRWKGQGIYEGKEFHDDQRCSLVLTRAGQQWKLLSEHCTQIVSP